MRFLRSVCVLTLALPLLARAEGGSVDWQKRVVKCSGVGAPNLKDSSGNVAVARIGAERAAKLDALRNCMEALKGVNIKTGETVGAALSGDPGLKAKVEGMVRGFKVVGEPRYFSDGGVEMDVEVPIDGIADLLVPAPAAAPAEGEKEAPKKAAVSGISNTGLIVNAKGLKLAPALAPRILDEGGKEVYGAAAVQPDAKKGRGVASYAKDIEVAKKNSDRVGAQPLVLKGVKAQGSDVVISNRDADALRSAGPAFLAEGRVVIVSD